MFYIGQKVECIATTWAIPEGSKQSISELPKQGSVYTARGFVYLGSVSGFYTIGSSPTFNYASNYSGYLGRLGVNYRF